MSCDPNIVATYKAPCTPTTAIVNAGKTRLKGFKAEFALLSDYKRVTPARHVGP